MGGGRVVYQCTGNARPRVCAHNPQSQQGFVQTVICPTCAKVWRQGRPEWCVRRLWLVPVNHSPQHRQRFRVQPCRQHNPKEQPQPQRQYSQQERLNNCTASGRDLAHNAATDPPCHSEGSQETTTRFPPQPNTAGTAAVRCVPELCLPHCLSPGSLLSALPKSDSAAVLYVISSCSGTSITTLPAGRSAAAAQPRRPGETEVLLPPAVLSVALLPLLLLVVGVPAENSAGVSWEAAPCSTAHLLDVPSSRTQRMTAG